MTTTPVPRSTPLSADRDGLVVLAILGAVIAILVAVVGVGFGMRAVDEAGADRGDDARERRARQAAGGQLAGDGDGRRHPGAIDRRRARAAVGLDDVAVELQRQTGEGAEVDLRGREHLRAVSAAEHRQVELAPFNVQLGEMLLAGGLLARAELLVPAGALDLEHCPIPLESIALEQQALLLGPRCRQLDQQAIPPLVHFGDQRAHAFATEATRHCERVGGHGPAEVRLHGSAAGQRPGIAGRERKLEPRIVGRLVAKDAASRGNAGAFTRTMSDEERAHDRHAIGQLCPDLESTAAALNDFLKNELEQSLLALSRAVAQGVEGRAALLDAADEYRTVLQRCQELRRALKRKNLELRAHEEVVCTPELGSF